MHGHTIDLIIPPHRRRRHALLRATTPAPAGGPPTYAYITNYRANDVSMCTLDPATGQLHLFDTTKVEPQTGPRAITVHPSGRVAYVTNQTASTLTTYHIDAAGRLTPEGISFVILEPARTVAVHPSGRSAYIPWYILIKGRPPLPPPPQPSGLRHYTIDGTGTLALAADLTAGSTHTPHAVAVDPTGRFAYVVNGGDQARPQYDTVAMFRTNDLTGQVTAALGTVPAGDTPESMAVDPTGRFAYLANSGSDNVSMYAIESTTGRLLPLPQRTVAAGREPLAVAVDPTGRFVYVANHGSHNVSMYAIEAPTGRLQPLPQATVRAGSFPWWVTVDPAGQFAYVTNHGDDTIAIFRLDPTTGQLSPNGTLALPAGSGPAAVVTVTPPALWLRVNDPSVRPGAVLSLTAMISPWPTLTSVDLYLALQLPDRTVVYVQGDGTLTAEPRPFWASWDVEPFDGELLFLTFRGTEPAGRYRWLAGVTEPGMTTFLGSIAQAPFFFSPTA
jgi:6-phosphogluconolactonase (cycloisomerase 2 family)